MIFTDFIDFHRFRVWMLENGMTGLAALIESFVRIQAGFLSSGDFHRIHRFPKIPEVMVIGYGIMWIFMDCNDFHRF